MPGTRKFLRGGQPAGTMTEVSRPKGRLSDGLFVSLKAFCFVFVLVLKRNNQEITHFGVR